MSGDMIHLERIPRSVTYMAEMNVNMTRRTIRERKMTIRFASRTLAKDLSEM